MYKRQGIAFAKFVQIVTLYVNIRLQIQLTQSLTGRESGMAGFFFILQSDTILCYNN